MNTRINKYTKEQMGLKVVNGEIVDKYGRILESFVDSQGYEDLKPTGRCCRDMMAWRLAK